MGLSSSELQGLAEALLVTFPSRSALERMVYLELDARLEEITSSSEDLRTTIFQLVMWAEERGMTAELIRAAQQWNPQNPAISKFVDSLSRSTRQDERTIPASSPKISASLRQAFVDALLLIPGIADFEIRSELLIGIPWQANLSRGLSDVRSDLETMVDQLGTLGQLKSGAWPLLILADNALAYAGDTEAEITLGRVYKRLLAFYRTK